MRSCVANNACLGDSDSSADRLASGVYGRGGDSFVILGKVNVPCI